MALLGRTVADTFVGKPLPSQSVFPILDFAFEAVSALCNLDSQGGTCTTRGRNCRVVNKHSRKVYEEVRLCEKVCS